MEINSYKSFVDNGNEIWAYEIDVIEGIKDGKELKKYECGLYNRTKSELTGYCPNKYKSIVKKHFKSLNK